MKRKNNLFKLLISIVLLFNLSGCMSIIASAGAVGTSLILNAPADANLPYLYENCTLVQIQAEDHTYQAWMSNLPDQNNFYDLFYVEPKDNDYLDRLITHHVDKAIKKEFNVVSKSPISTAPIFETKITKLLDPYKYRGSWYKVKKTR